MSGYGAYPKYRSTDVSWMPTVPHHWRAGRTKRFAQLRSGHTPSRGKPEYWVDCTIPWFSLADVWQLRDGRNIYLGDTAEKISDLGLANSAADLLPMGTVIVSRTASVGFSGIMPRPMATTQDFVNWIPGPELLSKYLLYVFRSMGQVFDSLKTGSTHKTIYMPDVLSFSTPVPPLEEQTQIVRFVDYETARIDALIEKQRQLIALLKEKRQAVISHAVTKGLNSNAPLRDSGVEWLGMVPAHWEVHALRFCAKDGHKTFTDGDWIESPFITDSGVRLLQTGNVGIGEFREKGFRYISDESFYRLRCTEIFPNDVLVCRLDGPVGRACLTPRLGHRMVTSVDNTILKAGADFDPRFLVYTMTSTEWISWIDNICRAGGGFRFRISRSMLGSQRVPAPPVEEQRRIADFLDAGRARHDTLINRAEEGIELLQERRTALISAAVTGKIDVRNWTPPESQPERDVA